MVRLRSFLSVVFCLFASLPALASIHVWTGAADGRFSNPSNWIGGSPAGDATAAISFPASSRTTATNDLTGLTAQSIAFSADGFTITDFGPDDTVYSVTVLPSGKILAAGASGGVFVAARYTSNGSPDGSFW